YARLTRAHLDADLVVWPESAIPLFYQTARPYLQELLTLVQGRTELLTGILYTDVRDGRYYNSLLQL
ncbi:MAG: apolipoprotein N-acyltransferase, partial [Anaerolineae bacterium]|nr:apolipoprotein N-acyltransferase [Anaerolineae bacterium]